MSKLDGNKTYQISIALRKNGAIEIFSDFNLASKYFDPSYQCVDIGTDYNQFYMRFVKVNKGKELQKKFEDYKDDSEIRQVRHFWRNQISISTSKIVSPQKWSLVLHKRVADFLNLFTSVVNFDTLMVVAHRNFLTVLPISESDHAQGHYNIQFEQGNIRAMYIRKRPKKDRLDLIAKKEQKAKKKKTVM